MKKRLLTSVFALLITFQFISCIFEETMPQRYGSSFIGVERDSFWVITDMNNYAKNPNGWEKVSVEKRYDSSASDSKVVIYIDERYKDKKKDAEIDQIHQLIDELAEEFNKKIYKTVTERFALPFDLDENGKVSIVLVDLPAVYAGYFFNVDFYSRKYVNKYNSQRGASYKTNEGDIIYLNYNIKDKDHLFGTASHEFMHLVSASHGIMNSQKSLDTWIEEGLAEAANHLYLNYSIENNDKDIKVVKSRVQGYRDGIYTIKSGYPLFKWGASYTDKLVNYSLSYLFFQFLYHHSSDKKNIFKNIIASPNVGHHAVIDAMNKDENLAKWGSTGNERFQKLLLRFYATNAGVVGDKYRYSDAFYKNIDSENPEFKLRDSTYIYNYNNEYHALETGAGVAVDMINSLTSFNAKCIYLSVNNDGGKEDFSGYSENDKLIVVNSVYNLSPSYSGENLSLPTDESATNKRRSFYSEEEITPAEAEDFSMDLINPPGLIDDLNSFDELTE